MNIKEDITPYNDKNQPHGYWEWYWGGNLWYRCFYDNGEVVGYEENYNSDSKLTIKNYYL